MLVLTRKVLDTTKIGEDIEIVILHVAGNKVQLGIQAPADVPIVRGELLEQTFPDSKHPRKRFPELPHEEKP